MSSSETLLREKIEQEVCVKRGAERMIPETSGWIMDFRRVSLQADFLDAFTEEFYARFEKDWPFQVGGAEVAAIPLVTAIVMKMQMKGKPVNGFFVRKSRKKTGLLKMVEGEIIDAPVILIDDLINYGGTFERQIKVVEEAKQKVLGVFTVLRFRPLEYYESFHKAGIRVEAVFTLDDFQKSLGTSNNDANEAKPAPIAFETKWRFKSEDPKLEWVNPKSGVALDEEHVYFGSDRGILWALDKTTGNTIWQHQIGLRAKGREIFSTPALHAGKLYFGAHDGNIYCLEAKTGRRLWVSFEADWVRGAPLLVAEHEMLVVPALFGLWKKEGGVIALHLRTGKKLWESRVDGSVTAEPVYVKKHDLIIVGALDHTLYAFQRKDGRRAWSFKTRGSIHEKVALDQEGKKVVVASSDGFIFCLNTIDGGLLWKYDIGLANYAAPYIHEEKVYVASLDKSIYCIDLVTGEKKWAFATRARVFASPRVYQGRLYIGGNDARLYELDPETGRETGYLQVTERITNPLQFDPATELFYLTTYANEVYCLSHTGKTGV